VCFGKTSFEVGSLTGSLSFTFAATTETVAHLDAVAGCVAINGHLHIDCRGLAGFTTLASLSTLTKITGALIIENCPSLTTFSLPNLSTIGGEAFGNSVWLVNNSGLTGSVVGSLFRVADVEGTVRTEANPSLCSDIRAWHYDWEVSGGADNALCGCLDQDRTGTVQFDNGICPPEDKCADVICTQMDACIDVACNRDTGACQSAPRNLGAACDDGSNFTQADGTCQRHIVEYADDQPETLVCRATPKPEDPDGITGPLPTHPCQQLDFCSGTECYWRNEPKLTECFAYPDFVLDQSCDADGNCLVRDSDMCFQPRDRPVLEVRAQNKQTTVCQATIANVVPGDGVSFELFVSKLEWNTHLKIYLGNEPLVTGSSDGGSDYPSAFEMQGHYEIEFVPSADYMAEKCLLTCYNRALAVFRRDGNFAKEQHFELFVNLCDKHPEAHCDTGVTKADTSTPRQCINVAETDLCERWSQQYQCKDPAATTLKLQRLPGNRFVRQLIAQPASQPNPTLRFELIGQPNTANAEYVLAELWHISNRQRFQSQFAVTSDQGAFSLPFLAPLEKGAANVNSRKVVVLPFKLSLMRGGKESVRHGFASKIDTQLSSTAIDAPLTPGTAEQPANARTFSELYYTAVVAHHHNTAPNGLHFVDMEAYAIEGTVTYSGQGALVNDGVGCPKADIQICAYSLPQSGDVQSMTFDTAAACDTTDSQGKYSLVLLIGSNVVIRQKPIAGPLSGDDAIWYDVKARPVAETLPTAILTDTALGGYTILDLEEDHPHTHFAGRCMQHALGQEQNYAWCFGCSRHFTSFAASLLSTTTVCHCLKTFCYNTDTR